MDPDSSRRTITRRSVLLAAPMALRGAAPRIGFCLGTYGMKDLPIDAALRLIARSGYDGVELSLMPEWQCDPARMSHGDRERLRALLHRCPRAFGKPSSLWTLDLAAEVAFAEGLTPRVLSGESVRRALKRLGIGWKRAQTWITCPDPAYARQKGHAPA